MIDFFSTPMIILYVVLFGSTMKIADLFDEHGLKWFKGSNILFGILFGSFGALLIFSNNLLTNFFIAMLIHWTLRYRIDCLGHGFAGAIMLTAFILNLNNFVFVSLIFWTILIGFSLFGLLNDMADRKEIKGFIAELAQSQFHYFVIPLILIFFNITYWIILVVSIGHIVSYEVTKYYGMRLIKKQETKR